MRKSLVYILIICLAAFASGCCRKNKVSDAENGRSNNANRPAQGNQPQKNDDLVNRPLDILQQTGLNYSLDSRGQKAGAIKPGANAFFETQYLEGITMMEKGEYSKAVSLFEAIVQRYPNSEEASVAELCIAELYFRNKANDKALETYQEIVEKYPNSHAAENAKAGIKYLQDFEKYEQEYIPADIEDRKRRGY